MSLGSLATIGIMKPKNLIILCVDNSAYLETGGQQSHTALGVDLEAIAKGSGFTITKTINNETELLEAQKFFTKTITGPIFVLLKVNLSNPPQYSRNWNASQEKDKFRNNLLYKN